MLTVWNNSAQSQLGSSFPSGTTAAAANNQNGEDDTPPNNCQPGKQENDDPSTDLETTMCADGSGTSGPKNIFRPYQPVNQHPFCAAREGGARPHRGVDMMINDNETVCGAIPAGCNIIPNDKGDPVWCHKGIGYGKFMRFACGTHDGYTVEVRYAHIKKYDANAKCAVVGATGTQNVNSGLHFHYEVYVAKPGEKGKAVNPVCIWGQAGLLKSGGGKFPPGPSCPSGLSDPANLCNPLELKLLNEQACQCQKTIQQGACKTTGMSYSNGINPQSFSGDYDSPECGGEENDGGSTPGQEGPGNESYPPNPGGGSPCSSPPCGCGGCKEVIDKNHQDIRDHTDMFETITQPNLHEQKGDKTTSNAKEKSEFGEHREWLVHTYFLKHILPAMMRMTSQLTAVGMQQVQTIGSFLDAKHQLETQRLFQQLKSQAHKDYHPSEGMCEFGTSIRSLAASERLSDLGQVAFAQRQMQRQILSGDTVATEGSISDKKSRLYHFTKTYCNESDNGNGLKTLCDGAKKERANRDVNYTRTFETALTLDVDFTKDGADKTNDEEDIFALAANLYAHEVLPKIGKTILANDKEEFRPDAVPLYFDLRSIAAKRSVALNSFAAMAGMKSKGEEEVAPYIKKLVVELGVPENEVEKIVGENPSYFAQMEVLAKKIYENPVFYTELYDKPANVQRKALTLKAIGLMQDRDIYKSLLRSEAVMSVILEEMLIKQQTAIANEISNLDGGGDSIE